jgi:hypothetical protein
VSLVLASNSTLSSASPLSDTQTVLASLARLLVLALTKQHSQLAASPRSRLAVPLSQSAASVPMLDIGAQRALVSRETARLIKLFEDAAEVDPYLRGPLLSWAAVFSTAQEPPPEVLALARDPAFPGAASLPFPRPDPVKPTDALPVPLPQATPPAGATVPSNPLANYRPVAQRSIALQRRKLLRAGAQGHGAAAQVGRLRRRR